MVAEEIIEDVEDEPPAKASKLEVITPKPEAKKNESWNKSIGALSKRPLANLVRSRKADTVTSSKDGKSLATDDNIVISSSSKTTSATVVSSKRQESSNKSPNVSTVVLSKEDIPVTSGLSLLANYSGSDSE